MEFALQRVFVGWRKIDHLVDGVSLAVEDLFDVAAELLQTLPTLLALKRFGWLGCHADLSLVVKTHWMRLAAPVAAPSFSYAQIIRVAQPPGERERMTMWPTANRRQDDQAGR